MTPAFRRITQAAVLLWWLSSIVLVFARPTLFQIGFSYRARRARRLMERGDLVDADRVIARLRWEAERCQRRVERRSPYSSTGDVDAS